MSDRPIGSTFAIIIAILCGVVAFAIARFGIDFGGFLSFLIGVIIGVIVWWLLMMGGNGAAATGGQDMSRQGADAHAKDPSPRSEPTSAAAATRAATVAPPAPDPAPMPKPEPADAAPAEAKKAAEPETPMQAEKPKPAAKPVAADGKPEMLSAPREGGADDLKQIKGVGPKLEKLLNSMGVYHFDQIAGWRKKEVEWVDQNLEGFKGRVSRDEWVKQAKVLAKGGTTDFSDKVKKGDVY
ncbi:MAG: NADH:quinone oxidoreductase [Alphaproteobacteria bacterium]|jgi:predicted flap endonuclease-1-like 5' DNA nuclease|nr:NADH:quinone oxidoreductase [Alphaproteobacteria bacterium]